MTRNLVAASVVLAGLVMMVYYCALPGQLPADAPRSGPSGLSGVYTVNGVDPAGVEYSGTVTLVETVEGHFDIEWIVTGGIHRGDLRRRGDRLVGDWRTVQTSADPATGTVTYNLGADGHLVGERHIEGIEAVATEELSPEP